MTATPILCCGAKATSVRNSENPPPFITQYVFDRALNKPGHADMFSTLDGILQQRRSQIVQDAARRGARPQTLNHPLTSYVGFYENPVAGTFVWEET